MALDAPTLDDAFQDMGSPDSGPGYINHRIPEALLKSDGEIIPSVRTPNGT